MSSSAAAEPQFVANDLALDFINTAYGPEGEPAEVLVSDDAVVGWLASASLLETGAVRTPRGIAALAIALREEARALLAAAQDGRSLRAPLVNHLLEEGRPILRLESAPEGPVLVEHRRDGSAASLLQPIAVALVRLLGGGDLAHVRQCEAHDCTLLFHDTTKSHKRRWCSMAQCGNRMKVAAFRARKHRE